MRRGAIALALALSGCGGHIRADAEEAGGDASVREPVDAGAGDDAADGGDNAGDGACPAGQRLCVVACVRLLYVCEVGDCPPPPPCPPLVCPNGETPCVRCDGTQFCSSGPCLPCSIGAADADEGQATCPGPCNPECECVDGECICMR